MFEILRYRLILWTSLIVEFRCSTGLSGKSLYGSKWNEESYQKPNPRRKNGAIANIETTYSFSFSS
jgi:hypothetical protein